MDGWTPQRRYPLRHPPGSPGRIACSRRPNHLFTMPIQVFTMPIWPFTIPIPVFTMLRDRLFTMVRSGCSRWPMYAVNRRVPSKAPAHQLDADL